MKSIIKYELSHLQSKWWFYLSLAIILGFGCIIGLGATISTGPEIFKNGSYGTSLMVSFLSLFSIFFASLSIPFIFFRESDYNFHLIYHSLPIKMSQAKKSKMIVTTIICVLSIMLFVIGFAVGQSLHGADVLYTQFNILNYALPFLYFCLLNTLFCIAFLSLVATISRSKMMVYVAAILLYILYMLMLIFTGSPLMAKGMPPSEQAVFLTSLFDPFGMSAFFNQTSQWSVNERNYNLLLPQGLLLVNRLGYLGLTILLTKLTFFKFDLLKISRKQNSNIQSNFSNPIVQTNNYKPTNISNSYSKNFYAMLSTMKIDLIYCLKSIPFVLLTIGFLFYLFMEMFGDIEKGVRLPQFYASSGLLASTIIDEFNSLCLIAVLFYTNDLYWRSNVCNFHLIESSTFTSKVVVMLSKWMTLLVLIFFFLITMIMLGLAFQLLYNYTLIDWNAYAGIFVFVGFRMAVIATFVLWIQELIPHRLGAMAVSALLVGIVSTSFANKILNHPTLELFMPFAGKYSDMNGFGPYLVYFANRYGFALCVSLALIVITLFIKNRKKSNIGLPLYNTAFAKQYLFSIVFTILSAILFALPLSKNYIYKSEKNEEADLINYEKRYRSFQQKAQPTVTSVKTKIDLYPIKNSYSISGDYVIKNKTSEVIDSILVNFPNNFDLIEANIGNLKITNHNTAIAKLMQPGDSLSMHFKMNYQWHAVNGHQSFNAIIENGSFMRISRFYPQLGYISSNEVEDENIRKENELGHLTEATKYDAPKSSIDDFINLEMQISTAIDQVAIGVGELVSQRTANNRNIFHYKTSSPIPFRFGLSSAKYAIAKDQHRHKNIEIFYHPSHHENVKYLIENIKHTMDYCENNFGPYPFTTIRFAEISGFTKGFAATAYPATIFMTENMIFHANIHADKKQDVIIELAGHELSHLWWGNNQIAPDERDGNTLLTETLAMYTELMLSKKIHGNQRMLDNVNLYRRMYMEERGYTTEQALCKLKSENTLLSYYKGLVIMYQLMHMIGEDKVNKALQSFLINHKYPNPRPISIDLISEFYAIADPIHHPKIDELFKQIVTYDFELVDVKYNDNTLAFGARVTKIIKDENGNEKAQAFNGTIEIGIYYKNDGPPQIVKAQVKDGRLKASYNIKEKPLKVVLDPRVLYLGSRVIENEF